LVARSGVFIEGTSCEGGRLMLHAGLDLSRRRLDYCLLDEAGERVEVAAVAPDGDGLRGLRVTDPRSRVRNSGAR